jgi:hypothetical protein
MPITATIDRAQREGLLVGVRHFWREVPEILKRGSSGRFIRLGHLGPSGDARIGRWASAKRRGGT